MKYIVDVQDLWPEAFCMAIKNKWLQKLFYPMELYINSAYSKADCVIAVSKTYVNRVLSVNRKVREGICVYLGNNGQLFDEGRDRYKIQRNDDEIWIGYVGSMGDSYDIGCVIDAIDFLQKEQRCKQDIRFVLCGDGEKRHLFEEQAKSKNVNADFLGQKPYLEMAGILSSCDIVINPIVKGSAASIINKVGDYALSGLPVINTQECQEYRALVEEYNCGINCKCGDSTDVAKAIETLSCDKKLRLEMGVNARRLGGERFDRRTTYNLLADAVEVNCGNKEEIVIVANFASSLDGKANGRFTYLAEILASRGRKVEIITSDFKHFEKKHGNKVTGNYKSKITLIHEPGYIKNISLKRLYSHWIWGYNVYKYLKSKKNKPGCIYCAVPSLTVNVLVSKYCNAFKKRCKKS